MTAPNKMAKRAAAGTLALAVCLTGGVLGAGAANAALPTPGAGNVRAVNEPGTGNTVPIVAAGNDADQGSGNNNNNDNGDTRSVQVDLGTTSFDTTDRILVQLPNGFDFNNPIAAAQGAVGDTDIFTATAGPNTRDISNRFNVEYVTGTTPAQRAIAITPTTSRAQLEQAGQNNATPLARQDTVTLTLGVRPASTNPTFAVQGEALNISVPTNTNVDTVNATVTSQEQKGNSLNYTDVASFDVVIAQTSESDEFAARLPANQGVTLGSGAQTVGPITLQEVAADSDLSGDYNIVFRDDKGRVVNVDTANSSSALAPAVDAGTTGYVGTVTPNSNDNNGGSFTVNIEGDNAPAGAPESVQITNLRIVPQAGLVGPITAYIIEDDGDDDATNDVEVEVAGDIAIMTINERLAGLDRYGTAAQVARTAANLGADNFPSLADGVSNVVLVNSGYGQKNGQAIDALTANYVAGGQARAGRDVPILLSGNDSIPAVTTDAIRYVFGSNVSTATNNYANKTITIVGGPEAVSDNVLKTLRDYLPGVRIDRVSGDDRYATAAQAVTQTATSAGAGPVINYTTEIGKPGLRTAVVASGEEAVDALSAGPYSYAVNLPLLLSRQDNLPLATENALRQLGIKNVLLLGGPNAVSTGVETKLKDLGITVNRINGADRYETSTLFQTFVAGPAKTTAQPGNTGLGLQDKQRRYFGNAEEVFLANGVTFADALVAGPLAGSRGEPLVLSEASTFNKFSKDFVTAGAADEVFPIGGVQVLEEKVVAEAKAAADGGDGIDGLPDNETSPFDPTPTADQPITGATAAPGTTAGSATVTFAPFAPGSFDDVSAISVTSTEGDYNYSVAGAQQRRDIVNNENLPLTGLTAGAQTLTVTIVADGVTYTSQVPVTVAGTVTTGTLAGLVITDATGVGTDGQANAVWTTPGAGTPTSVTWASDEAGATGTGSLASRASVLEGLPVAEQEVTVIVVQDGITYTGTANVTVEDEV